MVMKPEPVFAAVEATNPPRPLIYLTPAGRQFNQKMAQDLATTDGFSLLCGRYEGIDERIREHLIDDEVSVGDVVLAGGEVPALLVLEAVGRLIEGVLGNEDSTEDESFSDGLLEYPQYTRPAEFRDWQVPEILRSGNHEQVKKWRKAQAIRTTLNHRPDLIKSRGGITLEEAALLEEFGEQNPPTQL